MRSLAVVAEAGHEDVLGALLACGASIDASAADGQTALFASAGSGHAGCVARCLEAGAALEVRPAAYDMTPLNVAAQSGNIEVVRRLIAAGADVDSANKAGFVSVATAAHQGYAEICALLIEVGWVEPVQP